MMAVKVKFSIEQQITHMKSKGITFDIVSEQEAYDYLENNNYYFKIKSYAKMFEKYKMGEKAGKYVNLDFAYLKEMAILDMHLRHFIIKTSVDIEHVIKVKFMKDFNQSNSDGYEIVDKFLTCYPDVKDKILQKKKTSYCAGLIDKLESEKYAVWNIIELLSFGDFINLYDLFYQEFPEAKTGILFTYPMRSIKSLRNAAAHNNCILNQLTRDREDTLHTNKKVISYVAKNKNIGRMMRQNCMKMQAVHDFITLIYVLDKAVDSPGMRNKIKEELEDLVYGRMIKNKDFFAKNNEIKTVYEFVKKVVDNFLEP